MHSTHKDEQHLPVVNFFAGVGTDAHVVAIAACEWVGSTAYAAKAQQKLQYSPGPTGDSKRCTILFVGGFSFRTVILMYFLRWLCECKKYDGKN